MVSSYESPAQYVADHGGGSGWLLTCNLSVAPAGQSWPSQSRWDSPTGTWIKTCAATPPAGQSWCTSTAWTQVQSFTLLSGGKGSGDSMTLQELEQMLRNPQVATILRGMLGKMAH